MQDSTENLIHFSFLVRSSLFCDGMSFILCAGGCLVVFGSLFAL